MKPLSTKPIPITDPENEGSYGVSVSALISGEVVIVVVAVVLAALACRWLIV